ncbi:MAG TPA: FUSC family protein [Verrucomicrobiae bacterium]|jgi:uncharacterized membrane protein YgaE (UPF0421/DUF939 family)
MKKDFAYPAKLTIAAVLADLVARLLGLPEFYWAPITALVSVQPDFRSALTQAWQQVAGTVLGVAAGALLLETFRPNLLIFAISLMALSLISLLLRLDRPASRIAAVALVIVYLIPRDKNAWVIALHRFLEVTIGVVVGLLLSEFWPEKPNADVTPKS